MKTGHSLENLGDLGDLRTGYQYRSAKDIEPRDNSSYCAVQLNSLTDDAQINWDGLEKIHFDINPEPYLLKSGDVLLPLRGNRTLAVVVRDPPSGALAVGHLAILTPDVQKVDSDYLAWYWNHADICKRRENELSKGTNIQFISIRDCRKFAIALPNLEKQRQIARIAKLRRREQEIVKKIELLQSKLIDVLTMRAVTR